MLSRGRQRVRRCRRRSRPRWERVRMRLMGLEGTWEGRRGVCGEDEGEKGEEEEGDGGDASESGKEE